MKSSLVTALAATLLGLVTGTAWTWYDLGRGGQGGDLARPPRPADAYANDPLMPPLPPADGPQPEVAVDLTEHDFGVMERDAPGRHAFVFYNRGGYPLELRQGTVTCKCTMSKLAEKPIPPGGSAEVVLEWTAKTETSSFRQTAEILTNDPEHPRVVLTIFGKVQSTLTVSPPILNFGNLLVHDSRDSSVQLLSALPGVLLRGHHFSDPSTAEFFDVKIEKLSAEELEAQAMADGYRVTTTLKPGLPVGTVRQELIVETALDSSPAVPIPIAATISGDISLVGPHWRNLRGNQGVLTIGMVEQGQVVRRELKMLVRGPYRAEAQFSVAEVRPASLRVTIGEPEPLAEAAVVQLPLVIEVPADCPPVRLLGQRGETGELDEDTYGLVIIETNHPQVGQVRILVRMAVGA